MSSSVGRRRNKQALIVRHLQILNGLCVGLGKVHGIGQITQIVLVKMTVGSTLKYWNILSTFVVLTDNNGVIEMGENATVRRHTQGNLSNTTFSIHLVRISNVGNLK